MYTLFFALLFFPFCVTGTFSYTLPMLYKVCIYLRYFNCALIILLSCVVIYKRGQKLLISLVATFLLIICISTIYNGISLYTFLTYSMKAIFLLLYFELAYHAFTREMLSAVWWVCFILTVLNIGSIIFFPDGLYVRYDLLDSGEGMAYWFLGNRNLYIDYLYPMLFVSLLTQYILDDSYTKFYISFMLCLITVILTGSATTIWVLSIIMIYFIAIRRGFCKVLANPVLHIIIYAIVTVFVVLQSNTSIFSFIIVNILKKDLTLSSRTVVWQNVIDHIIRNPIIGYGFRSGDHFIDNSIVMHAHNLFLHFAYSGGIFAAVILVLLIFTCSVKINKHKQYSAVYTLCSSLFFAYLWMEFSEPRIYFPFLFAVIDTMWNIPRMIEIESENSSELRFYPEGENRIFERQF